MWKKIIYTLFLFFTFFTPPIAIGSIRLYLNWVLWPFALLYCFKHQSRFKLFYKTYSREIGVILYVIVFSLFRGFMGGEMPTFYDNCFAIMGLIVVPFYLVEYGRKLFDSFEENVQYILYAGVIAIGVTLLCLSIPGIDDFIRNSVIKYRAGEVGAEVLYRGFGWGGQMTSHYSYVIGIIMTLGVMYSKKHWFYPVIPFALVACLVNARTGAAIALIGIAVYLIFSGRKVASVVTLVVGILSLNLLGIIMPGLNISDSTSNWANTFFLEMETMSTDGASDTTLGYIWKEMLILPKDFQWLMIGNGYSLFSYHYTDYGMLRSDIGFVNQLSFGGLVYVIPLYYLAFRIANKFYIWKRRDLGVFLILSFLIINFKGSFLLSSPSFGLFVLLYYLISFRNKRQVILYKSQLL